MNKYLSKIMQGQDLSRTESQVLFETIMSGKADPIAMGGLLAALATKGESIEEITGAAEVMRKKATRVRCSAHCIDTCGTGGDGISTFNVSTTSALISAAAGATVAKHGNNTHTRASGSAEVMRALGINLDADLPTLERCLAEARIAFLYAIRLHPAMKHAAPVRKALGVPTIFNVLGPLTNPAGARRQVLGVNQRALTKKMAAVLQELGAVRAMVVHGLDGLCDLTITTETQVSELSDGKIATYRVGPESAGLPRAKLDDLIVDSPEASAAAIRDILAGKPGPRRDHAVLNAAAAIVVAGLANDLQAGVARAQHAIDTGRAKHTLERLAAISNEATA